VKPVPAEATVPTAIKFLQIGRCSPGPPRPDSKKRTPLQFVLERRFIPAKAELAFLQSEAPMEKWPTSR
jgi:hypothetical protein